MTKKEWSSLRIGTKVTCHTWDNKSKANKINTGSITRINSNCSQVYVKWDDIDFENWYGRLGIELFKN